MNKKIGLLDSGVGGTTVLKEITKLLPKEDYIYYADNKNNPYGEKTKDEVYQIVENIVDFLINEKACKMVVIACNTATTQCLKKLREKYKNIPLVGIVPAIKVACDNNYRNILVLATPLTISSICIRKLIEENKKKDQEITLLSCEGLAQAIEMKDNDKIYQILKSIKEKSKDKNIDSIVLGCTHYPLIKKEINVFFPGVVLIDGAFLLAKEVKNILEEKNLLNLNGSGNIEFIYSKNK